MREQNIMWFHQLRMSDIDKVGGKNASLGELISQLMDKGIAVPNGFATTAEVYRTFIKQGNLEQRIYTALSKLDVDNVIELAHTGKEIREWIMGTPFLADVEEDIHHAWDKMASQVQTDSFSVAVRSSATAEDLPDASFAGQQESFLNVRGLENVKSAIKQVFASLFNDRAIAYRVHKGFFHADVAISAGIQYMVRSDKGASGVMFTLDTESGFDQVVLITSSYGLGEMVVQGAVNPDEFYVHKPLLAENKPAILRKNLGSKRIAMEYDDDHRNPVKTVEVPLEQQRAFSLSDTEIIQLARYAVIIESHYGRPMDIEWGQDGLDGKLYILQARPETVQSQQQINQLIRYHLNTESNVLCEGRAIGQKIGQGRVRIIKDSAQMHLVETGDVLVTDMTDPDWEPVMKKAAAIVTNRGGRTCHAAIIARELGIPAVVGCGHATDVLRNEKEVTVSCASGDTGRIYSGLLDVQITEHTLEHMPKAPIKIMMNVGNPELAFHFAHLPNDGIGLARMEFIINHQIGIHPNALLNYNTLNPALRSQIDERIAGYTSPTEFYISKIAEGVATLAASVYPKPVIVRTSDFKSNEYANLIGGDLYEPHEENPMLGFRGAARYISEEFKPCFKLECEAIKRVRNILGFTNVEIMIPFVRTVQESIAVVNLLKECGLERSKNDLRLIMMNELPSNALLANEFLAHFDGFSIGSNDMTQLTLGTDRDSGGLIASTFDERDLAVKALFTMAIEACHQADKYIGICGQGPSDHPDFAQWLMEQGITSISLNPDTVIDTWLLLAANSPELKMT